MSGSPLSLAVTTGSAIWTILALLLVAWLVFTEVVARTGRPRVPRLVDAARWVVATWPGRVLALAGWTAAGWHVFCQRP